jgi:hypothetical protein
MFACHARSRHDSLVFAHQLLALPQKFRLLLLGQSLRQRNDSHHDNGHPPKEDADCGVHGGGYYHTNLTGNTTEPTPRKKGLTVAVSVLRLPAAEMQQMFHATTSHPFKGAELASSRGETKGGPSWLLNPLAELYLGN